MAENANSLHWLLAYGVFGKYLYMWPYESGKPWREAMNEALGIIEPNQLAPILKKGRKHIL